MTIPTKALAMLISGELDEWIDASHMPDLHDFYSSLFLKSGGKKANFGTNMKPGRGFFYYIITKCSRGHKRCVPFMPFHVVLFDEEAKEKETV